MRTIPPYFFTSSPGRDNSRGFTLAEVLVVVTLVSLLICLGIPAIGKVRQAGFTTQCAGNLRQIYVAIMLYTNEHNGTLPGPSYMGLKPVYYRSATAPNNRLPGYLHDYLSPSPEQRFGANYWIQKSFICPAWKAAGGLGETIDTISYSHILNLAPWQKKSDGTSLPGGQNIRPFGDSNVQDDPVKGNPRRLAELQQFPLSATWMMLDADNFSLQKVMNASSSGYLEKPAHNRSDPQAARYNVLFYDGRIENIPLQQIQRYP